MAVTRERPYGSFNFQVTLGTPRRAPLGFSEVVFPALAAAIAGHGSTGTPAETADAAVLLLRRGFDGRLDLYRWWDQARRTRRARPRTVTVALLDEGRREAATWTFSGCRPLRLGYSRLDANAPALLIESLELSFDDVTLA